MTIFFFLHIPKTGGSSVRVAFDNIKPKHVSGRAVKQNGVMMIYGKGHGELKKFAKKYKFDKAVTIIRDPLDRVVSTYHYSNNSKKFFTKEQIDEMQKLPLKESFEYWYHIFFKNMNTHLTYKQNDFIDDDIMLFDFAKMHEFYAYFQQWFPNLKMVHVNDSKTRKSTNEYITDNMLKILQKDFAKDFELYEKVKNQ